MRRRSASFTLRLPSRDEENNRRPASESEAEAWRGWLLRAIAGDPNDLQIMYGLSGERYLPERELTEREAAPKGTEK